MKALENNLRHTAIENDLADEYLMKQNKCISWKTRLYQVRQTI